MTAPARHRCSKCGHAGPPDDFPVRRNVKAGRSYWCRECHRAYDAAIRVTRSTVKVARQLRESGFFAWAVS